MQRNINQTGNNLDILIKNEESWASFATWYSINRILPNARPILLKQRTSIMAWPARCNVQVYRNSFTKLSEPFLPLEPFTMAIRPLTTQDIKSITSGKLDILVSECKDDLITPFVKFKNCGRFQWEQWQRYEQLPPMMFTESIRTPSMSINEIKVISLWQEMKELFKMTERG